MNEPILKEGWIKTDMWWHYDYHFEYVEVNPEHEVDIYDWLIMNIDGWHMLFAGVVILKEEDAMAFKLRWV